jgi:hypothetical protein
MALSSRTLKLKIILIKKASSMNFHHPTLLNKMGWEKERIGLSLSWQELCLVNTRPPTAFVRGYQHGMSSHQPALSTSTFEEDTI